MGYLVEVLKPWIMNIVMVIFFLLVMETLLPDGDMKQYIKVIMGLFVILVIIKPLLNLKNINSNFENIYIETAAYLDTDSFDRDVEAMNTYHKEKTRSLFENNIKEIIINAISKELAIEKNLINVQLEFENSKNYDFAGIKHVYITLPANWDEKSIKKIKKIQLQGSKKVIYKDAGEYNFNERTYESDLKNIVTRFFSIKKENIQIKFTVDNGGNFDENT